MRCGKSFSRISIRAMGPWTRRRHSLKPSDRIAASARPIRVNCSFLIGVPKGMRVARQAEEGWSQVGSPKRRLARRISFLRQPNRANGLTTFSSRSSGGTGNRRPEAGDPRPPGPGATAACCPPPRKRRSPRAASAGGPRSTTEGVDRSKQLKDKFSEQWM